MEGGAVRHTFEMGLPHPNFVKFGSAVSEEKI
jgi:hypothetical protein